MKGMDSTLPRGPSTRDTLADTAPPSTSRKIPEANSTREELPPSTSTAQQASATLQSPIAEGSSRGTLDIGECLSEELVLAFLDGRVPGSDLVRVHAHLDRCPDCQELIAGCARAFDPTSDDHPGQPVSTTFAPGSTLAHRYRIQRFVARGGMGEVYDAYDTVLQGRVALKTVVASASTSERAVRRLKAEVQLAQRVSHPNVCRIFDWGMHEGAGGPALEFLTMQFVEGETLARRLLSGAIPVNEAISIARQLLSGLDAAHAAEIVHRDLKTYNIMLRTRPNGEPQAYIMDFGLARALDLDPARLTTGRNDALVGTLSYMAPEQVQGRSVSAATDIYAFGIVFFEMLTGRLPFLAESAADAALMRLRERPVAPSSLAPEVPRGLDRIVLRCLAREVRERYASARQVLDDLDLLQGQGGPRPTVSKLLRLGAVGAGTVALGAAVGFGALQSEPDASSPQDDIQKYSAPVAQVQALSPRVDQQALEPRAADLRAGTATPVTETAARPISETRGARVGPGSVSEAVPESVVGGASIPRIDAQDPLSPVQRPAPTSFAEVDAEVDAAPAAATSEIPTTMGLQGSAPQASGVAPPLQLDDVALPDYEQP